jgi:Holliday junction resolvase RusA-like endonuclease
MLDWAKRHSMVYSRLKKQWTIFCGACARAGVGEKKIEGSVRVRVVWNEPNRRRDPDNVQAGIKFILDGIVKAGILPNDGWKNVAAVEHVMGEKGDGAVVEIWRA